ncbi:TPA: CidA/LrgA family protein [Streptococcus agalactiae]
MKHTSKETKTKEAPMFIQMSIYAAILLVSQMISMLLPKALPIPTTVIGLVLMYVLLTAKIIKVEWVDSFGALMISMIGFMFVPSGISVAANLDILKAEGLQLVAVITISTVVMLVVVAYVARLILAIRELSVTDLFKKILPNHYSKKVEEK